MSKEHLFTSESVTEGHPDKIADQISDSILDAALKCDPNSRVAIETFVTTGMAVIGGEMTVREGYIDIPKLVRNTIKEIGYEDSRMGFDYNTCAVLTSIDQQSTDIAMGVDRLGAGDQGLMFGFACDETEELMPLPIVLAHKLTKQLTKVRKEGNLYFLRPDGKSQVSVNYRDGKPHSVNTVVVSTQHSDDISTSELREKIYNYVIKPIIPENLIDGDYIKHINPTGRFVIGGPQGDAGLTGRKIIVDTYGGYARHGGGAFSGKDATKVDRSAAYMARYVAKNIVAAELASKIEIQLAYAIGVAEPVSVMVDTFGTGKMSDQEIIKLIRENFDLTPEGIINKLDLRKPIFKPTAAYGHFGRDGFNWEQTDMVDKLHS
ncbi:MAG: methionine adenosyltransferase [Candidatus Cloacimonadota bacterium]|nr:MAG: methionine adenosyltransferase [Candidatus Cloacimonadota bacterium]PIE81117.1 MAG: methionine adenosyltransferase [Candidatus Delongbacteria bacterium]